MNARHKPLRLPSAAVAFATLVFTTASAATPASWTQRIEADWLLAEEVAAQDQLGGSVTTKAEFPKDSPVHAVT